MTSPAAAWQRLSEESSVLSCCSPAASGHRLPLQKVLCRKCGGVASAGVEAKCSSQALSLAHGLQTDAILQQLTRILPTEYQLEL